MIEVCRNGRNVGVGTAVSMSCGNIMIKVVSGADLAVKGKPLLMGCVAARQDS